MGIPLARDFGAFGLADEWFESLKAQVFELSKLVDSWRESVARLAASGWSGAPFPANLRPKGAEVEDSLCEIHDMLRRSHGCHRFDGDPEGLARMTGAALAKARAIRAELASDLDSRYGEGSADSQSFRQFQAEYQCCFPASNVDNADAIIKFLAGLDRLATSPTAHLPHARILTLVGAAGVGKTHAICDAATQRLARGLRTIVLFGARFNASTEPWEQIRLMLGFGGDIGRDAMLAALDAAGEASSKPLLVFIDGLNETLPRDYWRHHLSSMSAEVERYEWIKLGVSCRSSYESQVLPDPPPGVRVLHEGFTSVEFDACSEFFAHYGLEPPVVPTLQTEFSNPLFLKLVCKAMVAAGLKRLPIGWHGLSGAIRALIEEKDKAFSREMECLPNFRYAERGLMAFVDELERREMGRVSPRCRTPAGRSNRCSGFRHFGGARSRIGSSAKSCSSLMPPPIHRGLRKTW